MAQLDPLAFPLLDDGGIDITPQAFGPASNDLKLRIFSATVDAFQKASHFHIRTMFMGNGMQMMRKRSTTPRFVLGVVKNAVLLDRCGEFSEHQNNEKDIGSLAYHLMARLNGDGKALFRMLHYHYSGYIEHTSRYDTTDDIRIDVKDEWATLVERYGHMMHSDPLAAWILADPNAPTGGGWATSR